MSTLHDMIEQKVLVVLISMGIDLLPYKLYKGNEVSDETVSMRRLV